jgi:Zn-dependent protease with chaperone function
MSFVRRLGFVIAALMLLLVISFRASSQSNSPKEQQPEPAASAAPHTEQAYSLPPEKLAQAIALNKIRVWLEIAGSLWGLAVIWLLLASGAAARLEAWARGKTKHRWVQGVIFFAVLLVFLAVVDLPLDIVGHSASLHYHVSVQRWPAWLLDQAKALGVYLAMGVPLALFFNWIVRRSPRRYWVWAWLISLPLILASVFLAPLVLDPIFNKFTPLEPQRPRLVAKLEEVVARTGTQIPASRMFLMSASEKSNGINAYVTGIGSSKRFVMWDTTMDRMPDDEIMFIFGHESGHYVLNHIPKGLAMTMAGSLLMFWICAHLAEWMVRRFGERWRVSGVSGRAGFLTLIFALSLGGFLSTPISNTISRQVEHEADVYGQEAMHGLVADPQKTAVSAFNHMGEAWLEDPNPNAFEQFWFSSHPSVQQRAEFAEHYDPWANGGHGKFFMK